MSSVFDALGDLTAAEWAQVGSALFTAIAASAALLTVKQGHRMMRAAVEPDLGIQVLGDVGNKRTHLVIANTGGGTTKGTAYQVVAGGERALGWLGDGFLAPGDKVLVSPELPLDDDAEAQVVYRTADESSWVVTRDGRKRRFRKGRKGGATPGDHLWKSMHPNVPWDTLPQVPKRVQWVEKRGVVVAQLPNMAD